MIFPTFSSVLVSALALGAYATPTQKYYGCDISGAELELPYHMKGGISIPDGVKPEYITLGVGTQVSGRSYAPQSSVLISIRL